jgi:hypothetical protein
MATIDITNNVEYKELLFEIFNCEDIFKLNNILNCMIIGLETSNNTLEILRLKRLIPSVKIRIIQLNNDSIKYN